MKTEVKLETEKEVTVADLINRDHIGITHDGGKYFIVCVNAIDKKYMVVGSDNDSTMGGDRGVRQGVVNLIKGIGIDFASGVDKFQVYKFDTRKELYQWLAE